MTTKLLHLDTSIRDQDSVSRDLTKRIVNRFEGAQIVTRDLGQPLPPIDGPWTAANFTPAEHRTDEQNEKLALSDSLIAELNDADVIVIGLPVYNFGIPAALKSWIDQIARAGVTFNYTENGPVGLLENKRAIVAFASGGTKIGSGIDFATGYLRHILGFIGITDVQFVAADGLGADAEATIKAASQAIDALAIAA